MSAAQVMRLDEVESFGSDGAPTWRRVRAAFGIASFGVNAWEATADGQQIINEHDELGPGAAAHEELYLVLAGRAIFMVDGERIDAPAGTLVYVRDPESRRGAVGETTGTVVLALGGKPGEAFSVSPWERSSEALRFWRTEEWDLAIAALSEQLAERPDSAGTLYNLACAEARAGLRDDALYHVRRAVEVDERFAQHAQSDPDLESVRDDDRFPRVPA